MDRLVWHCDVKSQDKSFSVRRAFNISTKHTWGIYSISSFPVLLFFKTVLKKHFSILHMVCSIVWLLKYFILWNEQNAAKFEMQSFFLNWLSLFFSDQYFTMRKLFHIKFSTNKTPKQYSHFILHTRPWC